MAIPLDVYALRDCSTYAKADGHSDVRWNLFMVGEIANKLNVTREKDT